MIIRSPKDISFHKKYTPFYSQSYLSVKSIHLARFGSSVVRALAMFAGDPGSIPGHATNFSNFSEGIGKPL